MNVKRCDVCHEIDDGHRPCLVGARTITVQDGGDASMTATYGAELCRKCKHDLNEMLASFFPVMGKQKVIKNIKQ